MPNKKNLLLLAVPLSLTALFLLWALLPDGGSGVGPGQGERSVAVSAVAIEERDMTQRVSFSGSLEAYRRVEIATRVAGQLRSLHVNIGDAVQPGALLAELDDASFAQDLAQARAELEVARASLLESQATLAQARRSLERVRELRAQRIASQLELETAQTEVQAQQARVALAESQIAQREAALNNAQIRLDYTRIHADDSVTGDHWWVAERFVEQGSILQANTPILALVRLDPLLARVHVTERDYAHLQLGQAAELRTAAWPGEVFTGEVQRVAPEFREASRQARVEISVPNADRRLRPGMFIEARVSTLSLSGVPAIPVDALIERDGQRGVFLVEEDEEQLPRARFVPVTTGVEDGRWLQLLDPPLSGKVVTLGQHLLSDGMRLRLPESRADEGARP